MIKAPANERELRLLFDEVKKSLIVQEVQKYLQYERKELDLSEYTFNKIIGIDVKNMTYEDIPKVIENLKEILPKVALYVKTIVKRCENEL